MQVPTTAPPLFPSLQDWFAKSEGALGDWFGGGLVRVEMARDMARDMSSSAQLAGAGVGDVAVGLESLNARYGARYGARYVGLESLNAWVQVEPSPAASELLRAAGHSGKLL
jgi:hypothetical protein